MISIITAIFGQLDMNRLFYESLEKYTSNPFELIIIDNSSTDGSREYFQSKGAIIIPTGGNYSYPYCQNLGIKQAKYDFLVFLNNDLILSPDWDKKAMKIMADRGLEIACCAATERMESQNKTRLYRKSWSIIKKTISFFGTSYAALKLMHRIMFPDWESYTRRRFKKFGDSLIEGFVGCNILAYKTVFDKIGLWDERIQGADFDIFIRSKIRSIEKGDLIPIQIMAGIYIHHYIRLTVRSKTPPPAFTDAGNQISLEEKWGKGKAQGYLPKNH